ncbi:MAG: AI-2E family transporter [Polyangiaceae bacterium]|nr:AI-2E family transporter [Polyangiaceae bacterium]
MEASSRPFGSVVVPVAAFVVVVAGLKAAEALLVPIVFALFVAVLAAPVVRGLTRKRVPAVVAIPLVVSLLLVVLLLFGGLLGRSLNDFVATIPSYQSRLETLLAGAVSSLAERGVELSKETVLSAIDPGAAMGVISGALTQVASLLSDTMLVLLTVIFLLFEVAELPRKYRLAVGDPDADLSRFTDIVADVKHYIVLKTYISMGTGVVVAVALWLLGIDFPVLWGIVAFVLNYVPNVGSIVAALPPVLLATVQYGLGRAAVVAAAFVAINMLIGNLLEPKLLGARLGLSTLVVFVSLVLWGWLWGIPGMLLSVPLTMVGKLLLHHSETWRWLAQLMEPLPVGPASPDGRP